MTTFKERYGRATGLMTMVVGAPKTGKSTFLASVAEVVPPERIVLLIPKLNEVNSYGYQLHGLAERAELFVDYDWDPEEGSRTAVAWKALSKRIRELRDDPEIDAVLLDPGTDAIKLLRNDIYAGMGASSAKELRAQGRDANFSFYAQLADRAEAFITRLMYLLAGDHPKHVVIAWHAQPATEDDAEKAGGIEFEGNVLPMIAGSYRRKIAADMDLVLYSDVRANMTPQGMKDEHMVQVRASGDRHAAIRALPALDRQWWPNNFKTIYDAIVSGGEGDV